MKDANKLNQLLKDLPYEVLVQFSKGTDDINVFIENMQEMAADDEITVMDAILKCSVMTLETYDEDWHINNEIKDTHYEEWLSERNEIKNFIRKVKKNM